MAFDSIQLVSDKHLPLVIAQGSFSTFISTLVAFTQNIRFPKLGLQSMDVLVNTIPIMATMSPQQKLLSIGGAGGSEAIAATVWICVFSVTLMSFQIGCSAYPGCRSGQGAARQDGGQVQRQRPPVLVPDVLRPLRCRDVWRPGDPHPVCRVLFFRCHPLK